MAKPKLVIVREAGTGSVLRFLEKLDGKLTGKSAEFDLAVLPETMQNLTYRLGGYTKIGNAFAGKEGDFETLIAHSYATWEHMKEGRWNAKRESSDADLITAIAEVLSIEEEIAAKAVEAMSADEKAAQRKDVQVVAVMSRIAQERAEKRAQEAKDKAKGSDTSTLAALVAKLTNKEAE